MTIGIALLQNLRQKTHVPTQTIVFFFGMADKNFRILPAEKTHPLRQVGFTRTGRLPPRTGRRGRASRTKSDYVEDRGDL